MADSIIDVPENDSDYDYCKLDKLREEAEQAERDERESIEELSDLDRDFI